MLILSIIIMLFISFFIFISSVIGTKTDATFWEKNKEYSNRIEPRYLIVYELDSTKSKTPFKLIIREKTSNSIKLCCCWVD